MRNTGGAIWNASQNYKLGSQNPQDNGIWGLGRVHLSPTERILPGETKTFTFEVTAPNVPGMYSFQWQMLQEMVTWFGEKSPPLAISVNPSGSQTWTFGATDQQDGTFFGPNDIAIMPDGRIVVSDWVNQQVQVFSPTFQFLTRFGKPGGGEQENNDMLSVAVSHDGRIFSADIFSAVKEFGNDYQFIRRHNFASGAEDDPNFRRFNFPHLSFDRTTQDNYIYVADQNNNRVLRLTRMGDGSLGDMRIFRGVNNEIRTPGDVAIITVGGQKRMYVSNGDNTVRVYRDPFGTPQLLATLSGTFTRAGSVAVSPANDRLYVSDDVGNRIHIFALETLTYLMPFGSKGTGDGQFDSPQGIAVDAAGNLYVTESGNNRIQKFTSEGAFLAKFGSRNPLANGKLHRAGSTAYDSIADELYVGDIYNCRIQVFDEQGNFRRAFGQCAKTFNTGGEYHGPDLSYIGDFDIDPSAGRVYIADSFNQRIAVYRIRDGAFLFSFGSAGRGPGQFDNPLMLEVANGKIYVGDWGDLMDGQLDGRVQVFTLNGQYTGLLAANGRGEGQVNQPVGIFDDPRNGRIFVSDAHHYTNIYGSDGQYRQRFRIIDEQTGIPVHGDGFIEQDGDMWLTTGSDRIERWNADNLTRISTYGTHGSGVGQFRYPSKPSPGLNGEMYIGDWNDKVTVYRPS
jgi:DNA-binding beta-propeller fold protein YncE